MLTLIFSESKLTCDLNTRLFLLLSSNLLLPNGSLSTACIGYFTC